MCQRIFYLPKNAEGKLVINRIINAIPCGVNEVRIVNNDKLKFTMTCLEKDINKVTKILEDFGLA